MTVKKIGLTGGIGSGKSIISKVLQTMNIPVFNSDYEAKCLMSQNKHIQGQIINIFGDKSYIEGELNRPYLASKIFNDQRLKSKLNNIIHPAVRQAYEEWSKSQTSGFAFNEAAILFETGAYKNFDATVLVTAPEAIRINRVLQRDRSTREEIKQRMNNQWSDEKKKELANFIINNDDKTLVVPQVLEMLSKLK